MDRTIKTILILAVIFLVFVVWVGLNNRSAFTPLPEEKKGKFSPAELEKIDRMLKEIKGAKQSLGEEEVRALEELERLLHRSKAEGRFVSPEEIPWSR